MMSKEKQPSISIRKLDDLIKSIDRSHAPQWFLDFRNQNLSRFKEIGIPTIKDEDWKYTNLTPITKRTFKFIQESSNFEPDISSGYFDDKETNIVIVDGIYFEKLSNLNNVPKGITVSTISEAIANNESAIKELFTKYETQNKTAFVALNDALNQNGIYIHVDSNIVSDELIHIVHIMSSKSKNAAVMPRTLIVSGKSSEMTILESYISENDRPVYLTNALTDIYLSEHATVHYCKSQKESLKAFHIGQTRVWQESNSNFDGFSFMAGSAITRNNLDVVLSGEGANTILNALYSIFNDQHMDNHTSIDHRVPHCTSNQLYKGVLNHSARAVFNGKVIVQPEAQQTNSYQLNKNLLLGKDCRIDTKPQLEIFADDVKCTHGATIGQLDEDEMFYLQTRGIPKKDAVKMLSHGFVNDLFNDIKHKGIREKLDILMKPSFEALELS